MSSLPVHKKLEALAQEPFSLDIARWKRIRAQIDALVTAANLDWSDEAIERERGHVPPARAHLHVLNLQYIAIRGTNKVMRHLLADAETELDFAENIQRACLQFEKMLVKYRPLRNLLNPAGEPEAHGQYLTLVESRMLDLTAELQRQRERIVFAAAQADVELTQRAPTCEAAMKRRLAVTVPTHAPQMPEVTEQRLKEALDRNPAPQIPRNDDNSTALRIVTAYLEKLRDDDEAEDMQRAGK